MADIGKKTARILVFSTEKISDPAIDMAGLLKIALPSYGLYNFNSLFQWRKNKLDFTCF